MKHSIARLFKKNIQKGINYHTAESQTYVQSVIRLNHINYDHLHHHLLHPGGAPHDHQLNTDTSIIDVNKHEKLRPCPCVHNVWQENCKQRRSGDPHDIQGSKMQHRCEVCSECLNSKDIMNLHMLDNHGFKCAICEDTVADKPQLKAHM